MLYHFLHYKNIKLLIIILTNLFFFLLVLCVGKIHCLWIIIISCHISSYHYCRTPQSHLECIQYIPCCWFFSIFPFSSNFQLKNYIVYPPTFVRHTINKSFTIFSLNTKLIDGYCGIKYICICICIINEKNQRR